MAKTSTKTTAARKPTDLAALVVAINAEKDMVKLEALMRQAQALSGVAAEQAAKRAKGRLAALRAVASRAAGGAGAGNVKADAVKWRALVAMVATKPTASALASYVKFKIEGKAEAPAPVAAKPKAEKLPNRRPGDAKPPSRKRREVEAPAPVAAPVEPPAQETPAT